MDYLKLGTVFIRRNKTSRSLEALKVRNNLTYFYSPYSDCRCRKINQPVKKNRPPPTGGQWEEVAVGDLISSDYQPGVICHPSPALQSF